MSSLFYLARRFKTATTLNLIGLIVAFAAFYLLMTQVTYNHSYNHGITNYQNLYRVEIQLKDGWQVNVNRLIGSELAGTPGVETSATIQPWAETVTCHKGESELKFSIQAIDGKALLAFQPKVVDGTLEWEEGNTNGIIIPASIARTYFEGETAVAGRAMFVTEDSVMVRGVYEDFPDNCCMGNNIYMNLGDKELGVLNNYNYVCYVRLSESADTAAVCQALANGQFSNERPLCQQISHAHGHGTGNKCHHHRLADNAKTNALQRTTQHSPSVHSSHTYRCFGHFEVQEVDGRHDDEQHTSPKQYLIHGAVAFIIIFVNA